MDSPSAAPLVRIRGPHKQYQRGGELVLVLVLQELELDIQRGDFLALMGPSGSGKSTLLNLIGGFDRATAGSIEVDGVPIGQLDETALARWRAGNVGFVFQTNNLLPVLSTQKNVELPLLLTRLGAAERQRRAAARAHRTLHLDKGQLVRAES